MNRCRNDQKSKFKDICSNEMSKLQNDVRVVVDNLRRAFLASGDDGVITVKSEFFKDQPLTVK